MNRRDRITLAVVTLAYVAGVIALCAAALMFASEVCR